MSGAEWGGEVREGMGQVVQDLGEDMGFYPRELGALEGCGQRRGRALTQMLTSTLWCLLRGGGTGVGVQLGLSRCGRLITGKVWW